MSPACWKRRESTISIEHEPGDHQLVITDNSTGELAGGSYPFSPEQQTGGIHGWSVSQKIAPGRYLLDDFHFATPSTDLVVSADLQPSAIVGTVEHRLQVAGNETHSIFDYPGGYGKRFDIIDDERKPIPGGLPPLKGLGEQVAGLRIEEEAAASLFVKGASTQPALTPGHRFTLTQHVRSNGLYLCHKVDQQAQVSPVGKNGKVDFEYQNHFSALPASLQFRPRRITPRPRVGGLQSAVVVGRPGEEIYADEYGRVKVQFHRDRRGQNDQRSSGWLRVGALNTGPEGEIPFLPSVGDEVLVGFLEGDPDRPVVVGRLYSTESPPPTPVPR